MFHSVVPGSSRRLVKYPATYHPEEAGKSGARWIISSPPKTQPQINKRMNVQLVTRS